MPASVLQILSMSWVWVALLAVAAFLVISWTLRGAPIGQPVEEEALAGEAPGAGYRDRVVTASVFALVLVAIAAFVAANHSILWAIPLFGLGFGMLIFLVNANQRYRHASPIMRRVVQFSNIALTTSLLFGILIVGNVLAFKYGGRPLDFTREGAFTLSSQTVEQLKGLERPVRFTIVIGTAEVRLRVKQLLDLYKQENPARITIDTIHPFVDLEKFEDLSKRAPDVAVAVQQGGGIVVEYGEGKGAERVVVTGAELFEAPRERREAHEFEADFTGEAAFTSALIRLKEGKKPLVAFITGHGEPPADEMGNNRPGLGLFKAQLTAQGANVVEISLIVREVPPEASLAVIASPRSPFQPSELTRLDAYMAKGGRVLAIVGSEAREGLNTWLRKYKVEVGPGRIVEPRLSVQNRPFILMEVLGAMRHPIVDSLARQMMYLPNAAPLEILSVAQSSTGSSVATDTAVNVRAFIKTSNMSWAESDPSSTPPKRDPKEPAGPLTVAAAVTVADTASSPSGQRTNAPRLVVFSCPDLADNFWVSRAPTNLDLVMNAVNWLRGRPQLIGIAPKKHVAVTLMANDQKRSGLVLVPTFSALFFIFGLGVVAYLNRRV
jgi:hypothetical protein